MDDELISIAEAARRLGLNKSTLSRQIKAGLLRSHAGRVLLSEVIADRRGNLDPALRRPDRCEPRCAVRNGPKQ